MFIANLNHFMSIFIWIIIQLIRSRAIHLESIFITTPVFKLAGDNSFDDWDDFTEIEMANLLKLNRFVFLSWISHSTPSSKGIHKFRALVQSSG